MATRSSYLLAFVKVGFVWIDLPDGSFAFRPSRPTFRFAYRSRTKTRVTRVNFKRFFVSSVPKEGRNNTIRHGFRYENIHPSCPSFRPGPLLGLCDKLINSN